MTDLNKGDLLGGAVIKAISKVQSGGNTHTYYTLTCAGEGCNNEVRGTKGNINKRIEDRGILLCRSCAMKNAHNRHSTYGVPTPVNWGYDVFIPR